MNAGGGGGVRDRQMAMFTLSELKRRRARLEERLAWLQKHLDENPRGYPRSAAEASALQTALVLFDEEIERARVERSVDLTPPGWQAEVRAMGFKITWHSEVRRVDIVRGDLLVTWCRNTGMTRLGADSSSAGGGPFCRDGADVAAWLRSLIEAAA